MPLDAFIAEAMKELAGDEEEVAVADAKALRAAGSNDRAKAVFTRMNGN